MHRDSKSKQEYDEPFVRKGGQMDRRTDGSHFISKKQWANSLNIQKKLMDQFPEKLQTDGSHFITLSSVRTL